VNKSINQTGPEVYLKRIDPRVIKSQCIPPDDGLWAINRARTFGQLVANCSQYPLTNFCKIHYRTIQVLETARTPGPSKMGTEKFRFPNS
jgi:hypothetical protein